jgi:hypothetical protein
MCHNCLYLALECCKSTINHGHRLQGLKCVKFFPFIPTLMRNRFAIQGTTWHEFHNLKFGYSRFFIR